MDIHQLSWRSARNICIVKTLAKLGHYPTRKSEKEAWFLSPLRSETQASFSVSFIKNLWFDFGLGKGGNIIDLVMAMKDCSFKEAMDFLCVENLQFFFCPEPVTKKKSPNEGLSITKVEFLSHPALRKYVEARGIPSKLAGIYCRQVWYRLNGRGFFAIGLENYTGGWELRNKYYKNSSSPKSYTYYQRKSEILLITEGMFDFLSLAILEKDLVNSSDVIILNSLSFLNKIAGHLSMYQNIRLYLANDPAGDKATDRILSLYPQSIDERDSYKRFKDLNEKLIYGK
ncbi:MAG: toprim domain-containing protein [Salinimicrobium sp.]